MIAVIIETHAADRRQGGGRQGTIVALPSQTTRNHVWRAAAAAAIFNSHRERGAYQASAIYLGAVFPVRRTVSAIIVRAGRTQPGSPLNRDKSVRSNFSRPMKATGSLSSFARVHLGQEQSCGKAPVSHVSSPSASASHEQNHLMRIVADVRKVVGEVRNV